MGDILTVDLYNLCKTLLLVVYSEFQADVSIGCPLKTSENLRFSYVLGGWGWIIGLMWVKLTENVDIVFFCVFYLL